jgi:hypothetical protein
MRTISGWTLIPGHGLGQDSPYAMSPMRLRARLLLKCEILFIAHATKHFHNAKNHGKCERRLYGLEAERGEWAMPTELATSKLCLNEPSDCSPLRSFRTYNSSSSLLKAN